jgi:hypothetical protein
MATCRNSGRQDTTSSWPWLLFVCLADRFPHSAVSQVDPNELEIAFPIEWIRQDATRMKMRVILMDAVRRTSAAKRSYPAINGHALGSTWDQETEEDLLASIVGLKHIKSQVRGLRRAADTDLVKGLDSD